jgi:exopolysaccharide biosynthesis polyprenyl glycosylphosphotransferase
MEDIDNLPLIGLRPEPLLSLSNRFVKRGFDLAFSAAVLVLLSPVFALIALLIKLTSRGPIFFSQERIGHNNRTFNLYKFRTMRVQSKQESDTVWTTRNDTRVTPIGRFLRKTNLDEFPQFYNVLIGNMSVVGPRPEREYFADRFATEIRGYRIRHLVRVGITGWAQVNGLRGDTSIPERVKYDLDYLENWSFWFDLKIIFLTLFGKNNNAM